MSIASRIESMNEHLENAYNSLENVGIDLVGVNKNLSNLSSEIELLYENLPKITSEDTMLTLSPTKKGKMKWNLKGNSFQYNSTGKNVLPYPYVTTSKTMNGITFVVNDDGTITANGIATDNAYMLLQSDISLNGEYTASTGNGINSNIYMAFLDQLDRYVDKISTRTADKQTATVNSKFQAYIYVTKTTICNNLVFKPMLRLSSETDDSYEPYTGGNSAPNQDYPQKIYTVTGNNQIKVCGKNRINAVLTNNGDSFANIASNIPTILEAGTYTIKFLGKSTVPAEQTNGNLYIDGKVNASANVNWYLDNKTFSLSKTSTVNRASCDVAPHSTVYVQLEKNDNYTGYESYSESVYPINLGELEVCNTDNYQDYIYKNGNNWYIHKEIRHLSLAIADMNNNENYPGWQNLTSLLEDYPNKNTTLSSFTDYICNISNNDNLISINTTDPATGGVLFLNKNIINLTQSEWKQNYPNLTIELYCGLLNPINIQITDTTLINQLNTIEKAMSYKEQTHISQTNDILPFIINASALTTQNS